MGNKSNGDRRIIRLNEALLFRKVAEPGPLRCLQWHEWEVCRIECERHWNQTADSPTFSIFVAPLQSQRILLRQGVIGDGTKLKVPKPVVSGRYRKQSGEIIVSCGDR